MGILGSKLLGVTGGITGYITGVEVSSGAVSKGVLGGEISIYSRVAGPAESFNSTNVWSFPSSRHYFWDIPMPYVQAFDV